jgi:hypothetical protein
VLEAAWSDSNVGTATGGACGSHCQTYEIDQAAHWTADAAEYQWLQADLAANPDVPKVAFFHFPLRSDDPGQPGDAYLAAAPGSSGTLEDLLSDNGVRLVFNGHAHNYQRFVAPPGGIPSYVTGGGGGRATPLSSACSPGDAYAVGWAYATPKGSACGAAPKPTTDAQVYHFLTVTVAGTRVTVTPVNALGQTFDVQTYDLRPDATAPSAPGGLAVSRTSDTTAALTWSAASDDVGVHAYDVYRDGGYLTTLPSPATGYTDASVAAEAGHTYRVDARDLAGNTGSAGVTLPAAGGGATIFADGFESGDLGAWSTVAGLEAQDALVRTGQFAARETSTGTATYAYRALPASTELWAQAWVHVATQSTSANLLGFRAGGGGSIVNLYLTSSGRVSLRNNVGFVTTTSTTTLAPGSWHRLVLHATIAGTSSSVDVTLDGAPVPGLSLTGQNLGTAPIGRLQLGETSTGRSYDIAFDDVAVAAEPL